MVPIARRNLFHDKIRLDVAVVGLAITVVLVLHNVGTLNYAMSTAGMAAMNGPITGTSSQKPASTASVSA